MTIIPVSGVVTNTMVEPKTSTHTQDLTEKLVLVLKYILKLDGNKNLFGES